MGGRTVTMASTRKNVSMFTVDVIVHWTGSHTFD